MQILSNFCARLFPDRTSSIVHKAKTALENPKKTDRLRAALDDIENRYIMKGGPEELTARNSARTQAEAMVKAQKADMRMDGPALSYKSQKYMNSKSDTLSELETKLLYAKRSEERLQKLENLMNKLNDALLPRGGGPQRAD